MSVPRKHHYLPQFYLSRWLNESGLLFEYGRPFRDLVVRERTPAGTGFQPGLYSIDGRDDPSSREEVELRFMQRLDDAAAESLSGLEAERAKPKDDALVAAWSRFVLSLVYRNPARIQEMRNNIEAIDLDPKIQQAYEKVRAKGGPTSYLDFVGSDERFNEEARGYLIRRIIGSEWVGGHLSNMLWSVVDVRADGHELLISDSPVVASNGVGKEDGFLIVPIGPRTFFLACNNRSVEHYFKEQASRRNFAASLNHSVVFNAEVLVLARTSSHSRFVDNRLVMPGLPPRDRVTWQI